MECVYIFVDEIDFPQYEDLKKKLGVVVVNCKGLTPTVVEKFNYIHQYFPPGEHVVFVEDDIDELAIKTGENKLEKFTQLRMMSISMFKECEKNSTKLWGISSNANPFYMANKVSFGFKFIVANLFGFVSTKDPFLRISQQMKSDYERTMLYFAKFGGVCRVDSVCAITKNYRNAGGLQEIKDQRAYLEKQACEHLVKRFPHLVEINKQKSETSMYMELRLKRIPKGTISDWMYIQQHIDKELFRCNLRSQGILSSK